uniref:Uncharacterized protein n=1 Tax=Octopus bimaculoides TaxID=37653 RepID=A0A0L8G875_OCTBM
MWLVSKLLTTQSRSTYSKTGKAQRLACSSPYPLDQGRPNDSDGNGGRGEEDSFHCSVPLPSPPHHSYRLSCNRLMSFLT